MLVRYLPSLLPGGIISRPMVLRKPTFGSKSGVWSNTSGCSRGIGNTDSTVCSVSRGTSGGSGFNLYRFSTLQSSISIDEKKRKRLISVNVVAGDEERNATRKGGRRRKVRARERRITKRAYRSSCLMWLDQTWRETRASSPNTVTWLADL